MPEKKTLERAETDKRQGKSASTQASEFVKEEMHHIREGNDAPDQPSRRSPSACRRRAGRESTCRLPRRERRRKKRAGVPSGAHEAGQHHPHRKTSRKRCGDVTKALRREGHQAASHAALSRQAESQAHQRTAAEKRRHRSPGGAYPAGSPDAGQTPGHRPQGRPFTKGTCCHAL